MGGTRILWSKNIVHDTRAYARTLYKYASIRAKFSSLSLNRNAPFFYSVASQWARTRFGVPPAKLRWNVRCRQVFENSPTMCVCVCCTCLCVSVCRRLCFSQHVNVLHSWVIIADDVFIIVYCSNVAVFCAAEAAGWRAKWSLVSWKDNITNKCASSYGLLFHIKRMLLELYFAQTQSPCICVLFTYILTFSWEIWFEGVQTSTQVCWGEQP